MNCKGGHFSLVNIVLGDNIHQGGQYSPVNLVLGGQYPPRGQYSPVNLVLGGQYSSVNNVRGTIFTGEYCPPGHFVGDSIHCNTVIIYILPATLIHVQYKN